MGKAEENKRNKRLSLLNTGMELFTRQGFAKTSVSDISKKAGLAKGTFYLYFHDKYDLRDQLVARKSSEIIREAQKYVEQNPPEDSSYEGYLLAFADYILQYLSENRSLLRFITKNLSWGLFQHEIRDPSEGAIFKEIYESFVEEFRKSGNSTENLELLLFTIIELISSTATNCILYSTPVSLDEYLPYLHRAIHYLIAGFTSEGGEAQ
ncbi:MAG: TetR/AcrR family transcriptional regulator [Lachnospiraceae bacterium]|jgi:AcrR family transcriptional regulator